ncbi:MAG: hypothetical protein ACKVZJ_08345 [Phycisphaerales bacterium]
MADRSRFGLISAALTAFLWGSAFGPGSAWGRQSENTNSHETEITEEAPTTPPVPPPPPPAITITGQTLLLNPAADQSIGAPSWPLLEVVANGTASSNPPGVITFVPSVNTPITFESLNQPGGDMQVLWTLSIGSAAGADGIAVPAGALRADVQHTITVDGVTTCSRHVAISLIPATVAEKLQLSLATDPNAPVTPADPHVRVRFCLGVSCTCPRCPNGTLFAAPFFVLGNCTVPEAGICCTQGCTVACASHGNGNDISESWIYGQGQFIICMLANAPD